MIDTKTNRMSIGPRHEVTNVKKTASFEFEMIWCLNEEPISADGDDVIFFVFGKHVRA
jgi:hypothetical protein